ncbi:hypothetical protein FRACYDRAFT_238491 [Fragilariopsis cylindrus CCMP1102]|uniref:EamA domain-containing protein n=1 Tax=Fragilariopsis cylindrus CCMP1102 TaxID=635003 RepID=A0A1E7FIS8_9STRA|nr:hypothetical protein FRACYDRAFT_238491 [Fragilariopsis cylindrus CCMP1102]|eukprot:OEU18058.1 hypothetical protein FRACYDRAFT_238491 [Fragilariopsis cylindrus CCMP1102]
MVLLLVIVGLLGTLLQLSSSSQHHNKNTADLLFVNGFVVFNTRSVGSSRSKSKIRNNCLITTTTSSSSRSKHYHSSPSSSTLFNSRRLLVANNNNNNNNTAAVIITGEEYSSSNSSSTSTTMMTTRSKLFFPPVVSINEESKNHNDEGVLIMMNNHPPIPATDFDDDDDDDTPVVNNIRTDDNDNTAEDIEDNDQNKQNKQKQKNGLLTIGFITFLFSTNSPVLHGAFTLNNDNSHPPSVLLVNAAVSVVAFIGLLIGGNTLEKSQPLSQSLSSSSQPSSSSSSQSSMPSSSSTTILSNEDNNNKEIVHTPTIQSQLTSTSTTTAKSVSAIATTTSSIIISNIGGIELGIWKFLGTTSNLFGLAYTTASHGALLIQLTTLIVPITRGIIYKEHIPTKIKLSIFFAVIGILFFATGYTTLSLTSSSVASSVSSSMILQGDILCIIAAICYSAYDIRLYEYGKKLSTTTTNHHGASPSTNTGTSSTKSLITIKIATQAMLSCIILFISTTISSGGNIDSSSGNIDSSSASSITSSSLSFSSFSTVQENLNSFGLSPIVLLAIVWSGIAVNAVAPFLQVQGQQIIGPTKCQTIYASQPLWAAIISFFALGETLGYKGIFGGCIFVAALLLAATTETTVAAQTIGPTTATTTEVEAGKINYTKSN